MNTPVYSLRAYGYFTKFNEIKRKEALNRAITVHGITEVISRLKEIVNKSKSEVMINDLNWLQGNSQQKEEKKVEKIIDEKKEDDDEVDEEVDDVNDRDYEEEDDEYDEEDEEDEYEILLTKINDMKKEMKNMKKDIKTLNKFFGMFVSFAKNV
jgi:TATA-binding protein-associated factor Taf7